jgi:hypothetical protein
MVGCGYLTNNNRNIFGMALTIVSPFHPPTTGSTNRPTNHQHQQAASSKHHFFSLLSAALSQPLPAKP